MKHLLLATAAALAPLAAQADEGRPPPHEPVTVPQVIVTATRAPHPLQDAPASVSVITGRDIRQTPAQSLDDVLRRVPSVDLPISSSQTLHPTALGVSMRGLGGIRALVLLDGVPLNDPFFGYVQWSRVPLESIERVEIVRGGGATLWGNYAMGGVINVITGAPDHDQLVLQAGGGSYGTYRASGSASYVPSEAVKLGLEASVGHTDGYDTTPADLRGPVNVPTSFTAHSVIVSGAFAPAGDLTAHLRIGYHDNDQVLNSRLSTNTQQTWTYTADATKDLGAAGALTATVFHDESRLRTDNTDTPSSALPGQAEFVQNRHLTPVHDTGASLVWSKALRRGWLRNAVAGVDYHLISGSDVADIYDETGRQIRTDVGRGRQRFLGAFGQLTLRPAEPLEVVASLRYQQFKNFEGFDGSPGGLGVVPDQTTSSVDPRVSVRWSVTPVFALRAAGYQAFRAPTLDNLYRAFATPSGIFIGNPTLRPETLTGGEAGFDVTRGGLRVQVTGFTSTIRNLITTSPLAPDQLPPGFVFGTRNINAGEGRSRGLEAEADWRIDPHWSAAVGYTFADSIVTKSAFDPGSIGRQQGGIPRHRASASVTYLAANGFRITPQARWLSESWGDNDNTLPVDEHVVADLAVSYPVRPKLEAYLQIQNLFDRRYIADNSGFELPRLGTPFSAFVGVRWVIG